MLVLFIHHLLNELLLGFVSHDALYPVVINGVALTQGSTCFRFIFIFIFPQSSTTRNIRYNLNVKNKNKKKKKKKKKTTIWKGEGHIYCNLHFAPRLNC